MTSINDICAIIIEDNVYNSAVVQTNLKVGKDDVIFVYGSGSLYAISSIDGEGLWKKDLASEGFDIFTNQHACLFPIFMALFRLSKFFFT